MVVLIKINLLNYECVLRRDEGTPICETKSAILLVESLGIKNRKDYEYISTNNITDEDRKKYKQW